MRNKTVRDKTIDAAIADGRLVPEARERWVNAWDKDPKATAAVLKELAPGLRPEQQALLDAATEQEAGLPDEWFAARRSHTGRARASGADGAGRLDPSPAPSPASSPAAKGKTVEAEAIDWPEFQRPSPRRGHVTLDQTYGRSD